MLALLLPQNAVTWINLAYLIAAILFVFGLKGLTHPRTAVRGNLMGATGMLIAIVATLLHFEVLDWWQILVGVLIGSSIGLWMAVKVKMTAMPQMVAIFNGFGGIASVLVAGAMLIKEQGRFALPEPAQLLAGFNAAQMSISIAATGLIGAVTFWGSLLAYAKLQGFKWIPDGKFFPGQQFANALLFVICVGLSVLIYFFPTHQYLYWLLAGVASLLGIGLVQPIGGADMPVVIALLNSYSGLAGAATGFVLGNNVLIVAGSLVGASGIILTKIMCKAMNRSLGNVVFGTMGPTADTPDADTIYAGKIKQTSAEEVAMLFDGARRVVIAPGYGLAVSQAQHAARDLMNLLEERDIEVEFAIHPVAGRMPGHMNVLLAEADVPYEKLKAMDEINPTMEQVDVAIVIGANDVVNPVARTDPNSPIAGMPILDVDRAKTVVVIKRSLSPGFAGIPNPLFAADNCMMFFSDGKKALLELIAAIKEG